jgi:ElaB/YqjD/DUF883 family membrane-anchored ribosome-binding protein
MMEKQQTNLVEAVEGMVEKNLDEVESQLDSTVDRAKGAVHELRNETQEAAAQAAVQLKGWLDRVQGSIQAQLASRPWIVIVVVLAIGFLFARIPSRTDR